jgi:tetratricopeptide (TPR) repeat protein
VSASSNGPERAAFVGRAAELATLQAAAGAADSGQLSIVLVSGEAGIGKTRLTEVACGYAREQGFCVLIGHCFDTESTFSYFPFINAFRQLIGGAKGRTERGSERRAATALVNQLVRKAAHSATKDTAARTAERVRLFDSVAGFVRELAARRPLLILLEDLHWADQGSLALLLHVVRMLGPARLLLIVTYRETDLARGHPLRSVATELWRHRSCQRIRLKGLSEAEAAALLESSLGPQLADATRHLAANIGRMTNGNPLFIHQVVRQLLETGRLFRSEGHWLTAKGWESKLAAQDGLLELVDARLSRLSSRCLNALSHAAVLGEEFEGGVIARMLRLPEARLARLFREAESAGILAIAGQNGRGDYVFTHALIRQSLYERLSPMEKRALHGRAAVALESVTPVRSDSRLTQLALHYAKSGNPGDAEKAVDYSIRAGERAYAVCAFADAGVHWRAALKLAGMEQNQPARAQLLERLGDASLLGSTPAEAARYLEAALELYGKIGQQQAAARVHARLVMVLSMTSSTIDVGQAMSHSRRAEKLLEAKPGETAEAELLIGDAIVAHAQFRTADGLAASQRAMELADSMSNFEMWSQAATLHGHFLWARGELAAGFALMQEAFEKAQTLQALQPRFAAAWLRGFSCLLLWDPIAAQQAIRLGLSGADGTQAEYMRQILVAHLGVAHILAGVLGEARSILALAPHQFLEANLRFLEGEWEQAERLFSLELQRSHSAQSKQLHWSSSLWLARLKRVAGEYQQALQLLLETPLLSEQLLRVPEEIATRAELALDYVASSEPAEGRAQILRCRALMDPGQDWRALAAFVERAEAAVLAEEGHPDEAGERFAAAGKLFSQYHVPWEVAETLVIWGMQLMRAGNSSGGLEKFAAAAEIYQRLRLGARWQARIEGLRPNGAHEASSIISAPAANLVRPAAPADGIYSLVSTNDVALLATLIHDAISHLMNAIDKAAKIRAPIERIASATEQISRLGAPVDRIARALEQAARNSAFAGVSAGGQRPSNGRGRRLKLDRSHDPGRPLRNN